jgi:methylenetetrahydrofolate dehydrogenase (NADP+)/methenyltetrahydrofolate cyclohydrolase
MGAEILDGKALARTLRAEAAAEARQLEQEGVKPCLRVVLAGDDPASAIYVGSKEKACARAGIESVTHRLPGDTREEEVLGLVGELNRNPRVHGILVQLPLPEGIDEAAVISAIDPVKDVDGFTPSNLGRLLMDDPYTLACTPAGILELLDRSGLHLEGMNAVVIGRSLIVGKPLAALLMQKAPNRNATVTVCHSRTRDLSFFTRNADLVVTALGSPAYLKADMVKRGVVVVDVGINRVPDPASPKGYRVVGDADFEALAEVASHITPVPGGVGPLTVAMLLKNTVKAARFQACGL